MSTMQEIDKLTEQYAARREALAGAMLALDDDLKAVKRRHVTRIRKLAEGAKQARHALHAQIVLNPTLFEKPRTQIFHGVRVGYQKGKGRIDWEDDASVVKLIRRHLPDQADVLIATKESPVKAALGRLTAPDLKRIGVHVVDAGDEVLIKDAVGEIDRLVDALLKADECEEVPA